MGNALLCLKGHPPKLKTHLRLTLSRLAILRSGRRARCLQAHADVAQLLALGHLDTALFRAEQAIREQNMLDVFVMVESYCHLLTERDLLLENHNECPEELREAVSGLSFAASRCGDLHELQDVRRIFASKFGKDFTTSAVELRNNCGVDPKLIQKLSPRQPSLQSRRSLAKQIAKEKGIEIEFEETPEEILMQGNQSSSHNTHHSRQAVSPSTGAISNQLRSDRNLSGQAMNTAQFDLDGELSREAGHQYKDAESAANAAYESASYAAAAAWVAMELARSESRLEGSSPSSSSHSSEIPSKEDDMICDASRAWGKLKEMLYEEGDGEEEDAWECQSTPPYLPSPGEEMEAVGAGSPSPDLKQEHGRRSSWTKNR